MVTINRILEWLLGISIMFLGLTIFSWALCFNLIGYGIWEIRGLWLGLYESALITAGMLIGIGIMFIGGIFCYSHKN